MNAQKWQPNPAAPQIDGDAGSTMDGWVYAVQVDDEYQRDGTHSARYIRYMSDQGWTVIHYWQAGISGVSVRWWGACVDGEEFSSVAAAVERCRDAEIWEA